MAVLGLVNVSFLNSPFFRPQAVDGLEAEDGTDAVNEGVCLSVVEFSIWIFELLDCGPGAGAGVAILLELEDRAADAGQGVGEANAFVRICPGLFAEFGDIAQQLAEVNHCELEAAFGEPERVDSGGQE